MRPVSLLSTLILCAACGEPAPGKGGGAGDGGGADSGQTDGGGEDGGGEDGGGEDGGGLPGDEDGDGYADEDDCAPDDPDINPGAEEIPYNGVDDDCAGDGDLRDVDGDGHEAELVGGDDCDDQNDQVYPGAYDGDNGEDDNCDGEIDEDVYVEYEGWPIHWGSRYTRVGASAVGFEADGQLLVMGTWKGKVDFDPSVDAEKNRTSDGNFADIFVSRFNLERQWDSVYSISGPDDAELYAESLAIDPIGGSLVAGSYSDEADFDDGTPQFMLRAKGREDGFVSRFAADGSLYWALSFGGANDDKTMAVTANDGGQAWAGGYIAAKADLDPGGDGYEQEPAGYRDGYVVQLDAFGAAQWVGVFASDGGSSTDTAEVHQLVISGEALIVAGVFLGTVDLDPTDGTESTSATGSQDLFIASLDPQTGALNWVTTYGGTGSGQNVEVDAISATADGGVAISGAFDDRLVTSEGTWRSSGRDDGYLLVLDSNGAYSWGAHMASAGLVRATGVAIADDGDALLSVTYGQTLTFNSETVTSDGGIDCHISRLNPDGSFDWTSRIRGIGNENCVGLAIGDEYALYAGMWEEVTEFGLVDSDEREPVGYEDAWVHRSLLTGPESESGGGSDTAGDTGR